MALDLVPKPDFLAEAMADAAARSDLPHPAFSIIVNDVGSGELIVTPIPGRH